MARLRRPWRVAKWAGAGACICLAATWLVSLPWTWQYVSRDRSGVAVTLSHGALTLDQMYVGKYGYIGCHVFANDSWRPYLAKPFVEYHEGSLLVFLNLLPMAVVTMAAAVFLFWRDRRTPPHCCQSCGYDLTGNSSGVCPECGV